MGGRRLSAEAALLALVLAIAAALRVSGIGYGLPQLLDLDEPIFSDLAMKMVAERTLRPGWYGAPGAPVLDLLALAYNLVAGVGMALGSFADFGDVVAAYKTDRAPFFLIGRALTALVSWLAVLALYRTLRKGFAFAPALLGAAVLAVSPGVVTISQIIRMDAFLTLFLILVVHFAIDAARGEGPRAYVFAGVALGFAVVSKYPGVVGVVVIACAAAESVAAGRAAPGAALRGLGLAALASVATAFAVAPYLFLDFAVAVENVLHEARAYHLGRTSAGFLPALGFYLGEALPAMVGWPAYLGGVLGLALLAGDRTWRPAAVFVPVFLVFLAALPLTWERWAVPLAPFLALGVARLGSDLERLARGGGALRRAAPALLALLVLAPPTLTAVRESHLRAADRDTRVVAERWIRDHLPRGAVILVEEYAPQLSAADYDLRVLQGGRPMRWLEADFGPRLRPWIDALPFGAPALDVEGMRRAGIEYVVLADWYDRYKADAPFHAGRVAFYEALLARTTPVAEFAPGPALLGPKIRVLRIPARPRP